MKNALAIGVLVIAASGAGCGRGHETSSNLRGTDWQALDEAIGRFREERQLPGLSVAVLKGPDVVFAKGYGWADAERQRPVTSKTLFPIGSIEKQFTAAAVMRLVEQGQLTLDDPITKYLPRLDTSGRTITIGDMLHQVSGLQALNTLAAGPHGQTEPGTGANQWGPIRDLQVGAGFDSSEDIGSFVGQPLYYPPRQRWSYSQPNYDLLCYVIAGLTGRTYYDAIQELAAAAGLAAFHAEWTPRPSGDDPDVAHGYRLAAGGFEEAWEPNLGSAWTTAVDLARWGWALGHGLVVSPESYARMTSPARLSDGRSWPYGFGFGLTTLEGRRRLVHTGVVLGFHAGLARYPEEDLTIAVMTNLDRAWIMEGLEPRIARALFGVEEPARLRLPVSGEERARYVGTYDAGSLWFDIVPDDDGIAVIMREPDAVGNAAVIYRDALLSQGSGEFLSDGRPDWIRVTFPAGPGPAPEATVYWDGIPSQAVRR